MTSDKLRELLKVLAFEKSRGCQDGAVIGGLSKYLAHWKGSIDPEIASSPQIAPAIRLASTLDGYSVLPVAQRMPLLMTAMAELTALVNTAPSVIVQNSGVEAVLPMEEGRGTSPPRVPSGRGNPAATPKSEQISPPQSVPRVTKKVGNSPVETVLTITSPAQSSETNAPAKPSARRTASASPAASRQPAASGASSSGSALDAPVTVAKGINTATAARLGKLGLTTVKDLLYFFPRRHNDFSMMKRIADLVPGAEETIVATIWEVSPKRFGKSGKTGVEIIVGDESGTMRAVFFNQPYIAKTLRPNTQVVLSGRVEVFRGERVFQSPQYEQLESDDLVHTGRIVPVYPLTEGLYQRSVRRIVKGVVDRWASSVQDHIPEVIRKRAHLLELAYAISQIHYPDSQQMLDKAKERLAFDELFAIQLGALTVRRRWRESQPGHAMAVDQGLVEFFLGSLPFRLTGAQQRTLEEILEDQAKTASMARLLQGEVGSGKTVVAAVALLVAVANGFQGVLMAPTEILAEQHFRTLTRLYGNLAPANESRSPGVACPIPRVLLLTGSLKKREKDDIHRAIVAGEVDVVVGTQAIIQEGVEFDRLGLCIVDEQHRFGVLQRSALRQKGYNPDALVMTATPIPRTLALTVYGDLDLSVIDELPPGRQEIKTRWLKPEDRYRAYEFLRKQVKNGRQVFVICPLVEESDKIEAKAATAEYERLSREVFPELKLGLLHGRMKPTEKDGVMRQFGAGELDIMVSTTVVEVGIDVPNATVMMVEGADRFGLSQLHQLRGRVGRGAEQSYCILLADSPSSEGRERLEVIEKTQDGFALAEEDMRLRGPGEFLGTRQSGLPDLKVAKLSDIRLIELARREALALFGEDPELTKPENRLLAKHIAATWQRESDLS